MIDGLNVRGKLLSIEQVRRKVDGAPIDGMYRAKFRSSRGDVNVDIRETFRTPAGEIDLPAYATIMAAEPGTEFAVALYPIQSERWTNYLAFVAEPVGTPTK